MLYSFDIHTILNEMWFSIKFINDCRFYVRKDYLYENQVEPCGMARKLCTRFTFTKDFYIALHYNNC